MNTETRTVTAPRTVQGATGRLARRVIDSTLGLVFLLAGWCDECGQRRPHAEGCPHAPRHFTKPH